MSSEPRDASLTPDAARRDPRRSTRRPRCCRPRTLRGFAEVNFEQRRQLVLLLIDRVIVTDADVEIRYVLPTSPEGEHVRFCHLRKDYFDDPETVCERGAAAAEIHPAALISIT